MKTTLYALMVFIFLLTGCAGNKKKRNNKEVAAKKDSIVEQKFISDEYSFSMYHPAEWKTEVFDVGNDQAAIGIYPEYKTDSIDFPLTIHERADICYISIFPGGYGTELPSGKSRAMERDNLNPVILQVDRKESLVFFLENGQQWGYFIVPSSPPASWSPHGFIFAQAAVKDFAVKCFDKNSGEELEMSECDPLTGDSVVRYGKVVEEDLQTIKRILNSIQFAESNNGQQSDSSDEAKGIAITSPQSGSVITSPLEITGKARGSWFFEALIEIELRKDGTILAETTGKAEGNWMTQDYVDFTATLEFSAAKETGAAELIFRSSNPSGKSSMEKSFSIPVEIR